MKKVVIPIIVMLLTTLSGCEGFFPAASEIESYDTIQIIGIDVSEDDPSQIEVTLISKAEKSTGSETSGGVTINTYWASGPTAFETQRGLRAKEDKVTFLGYVDYILIGEKAAQEDFTKYFDYVVRDHETRLSPKVFVIRDCTVKDFIKKTSSSEMFLADRLDNIINGKDILANTTETRAIKVMGMLDNTKASTVIPALECDERHNHDITGEMPEKHVDANGYAIIKDFKLAGFIEADCASGFNFLTNVVDSYPVSVKDNTGAYVGLEVVKSDTKMEAHFDGDKLEGVTYKTFVTSALPEQQSRQKIATREGVAFMCSEQSQTIKLLMEDVIKTSKELKTDCIGLGERIRIQYPYKWEKIKDKWKEMYPELKVDVSVDSEIVRSYDFILPNGYQKGEE
ncbi:MAG: hypothetical protein CVU91_10610 [Firmicutes bacterium HGW-Firmicutes-16]|nr:MAG: hypothetical protein CVU91_10610 [Firmicutes bacterium HGW-Firmicutes-16]